MIVACEGDRVIIFSKDYKTYSLTLRAGAKFQTHRGIIEHNALIGQPLGREVRSHTGYAFLALEPSTYDLIRLTKRISQIMFPKDIGYLLLRLNIFPGVRVIEAGTGSGGLTTALARMVQPSGQVYSYDQRADAQEVARQNLVALGLAPFVTFQGRNIADGFDETDVDALFFDLRDPWEYLPQASAALKGGGFFGAIVPTTNQVSRLLHDLRINHFSAHEVEEVLVRPYKAISGRLRPMDRMIAHTGYLIFARKVIDELDEEWFTPKHGRHRARERGDADDEW
ncbi:MAG: tRNA (adenine-N1)-methyltransferase [Anaerolineae bacterium]|nr:tRNA (adenine-N1)-methyltransferase [Anaerolineae bacterium]